MEPANAVNSEALQHHHTVQQKRRALGRQHGIYPRPDIFARPTSAVALACSASGREARRERLELILVGIEIAEFDRLGIAHRLVPPFGRPHDLLAKGTRQDHMIGFYGAQLESIDVVTFLE